MTIMSTAQKVLLFSVMSLTNYLTGHFESNQFVTTGKHPKELNLTKDQTVKIPNELQMSVMLICNPHTYPLRSSLPLADEDGWIQLVSLRTVPRGPGDVGAASLVAHQLAEGGHHMLTHQLELGRQDAQNVHLELLCTALHSLWLRTAILQ